MSDTKLRELERRWRLDRTPGNRAAVLQARAQAGAPSGLPCPKCKATGEGPWRSIGTETYTRRVGELCCCGDERDAGQHGSGGVEEFTHNHVHACTYYGGEDAECQCVITEEQATREIRTRACVACNGSKRARLGDVFELCALMGDEACRLLRPHATGWDAPDTEPFSRWLQRLNGRELLTWTWVAVAQEVIAGMPEEGSAWWTKGAAQEVLARAVDWLRTPDEQARRAWVEASLAPPVRSVQWIAEGPDYLPRRVELCAKLIGDRAAKAAICELVVPWLLGESDAQSIRLSTNQPA